jgi:hypothetical protein
MASRRVGLRPVGLGEQAREGSVQLGIWSICYGLSGRHSTEEPVELCITQARYTQLHQYTNYSQG